MCRQSFVRRVVELMAFVALVCAGAPAIAQSETSSQKVDQEVNHMAPLVDGIKAGTDQQVADAPGVFRSGHLVHIMSPQQQVDLADLAGKNGAVREFGTAWRLNAWDTIDQMAWHYGLIAGGVLLVLLLGMVLGRRKA